MFEGRNGHLTVKYLFLSKCIHNTTHDSPALKIRMALNLCDAHP